MSLVALTTFWPIIKIFVFSPILTRLGQITHECYNLTEFGQDWTENKKEIIIGQTVVRTPFLKTLPLVNTLK